MAKRNTAADGTAGAGGNTGGDTARARKPKAAADMRVVRIVKTDADGGIHFEVIDAAANIKAGNAIIDANTEAGKYAIITIREVREIVVQPVSRKAAL